MNAAQLRGKQGVGATTPLAAITPAAAGLHLTVGVSSSGEGNGPRHPLLAPQLRHSTVR
jgi:hypothetical protein